MARRGRPPLVPYREPNTPEEWREAVDFAELFLLIDSARLYGLVRGGPHARTSRCVDILERGAALGYKPRTAQELAEWAFGGTSDGR